MQLSEYRVRIGTDSYQMWLAASVVGGGEPLLATPFVLAPPSDEVFNKYVAPVMNHPQFFAKALYQEVSSRVITHAGTRHAGVADVYLRHEVDYEAGVYVLRYPMTRDTARRISLNTLYCVSCGEPADAHQGDFCALHLGVGFERPQVSDAPNLESICKFHTELPHWLGRQADSIYITATEGLRNAHRKKTEVRTGDNSWRELDTGRADR